MLFVAKTSLNVRAMREEKDQPMMLSNKNLNSENRTCSVVQSYSLTILQRKQDNNIFPAMHANASEGK